MLGPSGQNIGKQIEFEARKQIEFEGKARVCFQRGTNMTDLDIIAKKRDKQVLNREEIDFMIGHITDGSMPDYQLGALLMAIYLNGMNEEECVNLTMAMAHSGDMMDLSEIPGFKLDKHSTGGVGDTTTLVLAPLVAACGGVIAKLSGRGLGHTGGTLDKLESIPGVSTSLTEREFIDQVKAIGIAVAGQTRSLTPADKIMYAMRDVTATVGSIPLIVSSILSKKIAAGADSVTLDVKTGSGAAMPNLRDSIDLARMMVDIGCGTGHRFSALVTDMEQPLGLNVGNLLEVREAIEILSGRCEGDLKKVALRLGNNMLQEAGLASSEEESLIMLENAIQNGSGLKKMADMVEMQGGDRRIVYEPDRLAVAQKRISFVSNESGYLSGMYSDRIGNAARLLGAGRMKKEDVIDPVVGFVMQARLGEWIDKGQPLLEMHVSDTSDVSGALQLLEGAFKFSEEKPEPRKLVYNVIRKS